MASSNWWSKLKSRKGRNKPKKEQVIGWDVDEELSAIDMLEASQLGEIEVVKACLNDGIDPNSTADSGRTALHFASGNGHLKIVKLLLKSGAKVDALNNSGHTPLLVASYLGHRDVVIELIHYEADVNRVDPADGSTPLHCASYSGKLSTLLTLIQSGADVNRQDKYGKTPLMWASDKVITKALLDHGANVHASDKNGQTALHCAVVNNVDAIVLLIENGADPDTTDAEGRTAWDWARNEDNSKALDMMTSKWVETIPEVVSEREWNDKEEERQKEVAYLLGRIADLKEQLSSARTNLKAIEDEKLQREIEIKKLKEEKEKLLSLKPETSRDVEDIKRHYERVVVKHQTVFNVSVSSSNVNSGQGAGETHFNFGCPELEAILGERLSQLNERIAQLETELEMSEDRNEREIRRLRTRVEELETENDQLIALNYELTEQVRKLNDFHIKIKQKWG